MIKHCPLLCPEAQRHGGQPAAGGNIREKCDCECDSCVWTGCLWRSRFFASPGPSSSSSSWSHNLAHTVRPSCLLSLLRSQSSYGHWFPLIGRSVGSAGTSYNMEGCRVWWTETWAEAWGTKFIIPASPCCEKPSHTSLDSRCFNSICRWPPAQSHHTHTAYSFETPPGVTVHSQPYRLPGHER